MANRSVSGIRKCLTNRSVFDILHSIDTVLQMHDVGSVADMMKSRSLYRENELKEFTSETSSFQ